MSKKILQLISEDFEDLEVWYPVYRCREEGWQVDFAAEKPGLYHGKYGVPCEVSLSVKLTRINSRASNCGLYRKAALDSRTLAPSDTPPA